MTSTRWCRIRKIVRLWIGIRKRINWPAHDDAELEREVDCDAELEEELDHDAEIE